MAEQATGGGLVAHLPSAAWAATNYATSHSTPPSGFRVCFLRYGREASTL